MKFIKDAFVVVPVVVVTATTVLGIAAVISLSSLALL